MITYKFLNLACVGYLGILLYYHFYWWELMIQHLFFNDRNTLSATQVVKETLRCFGIMCLAGVMMFGIMVGSKS